MNQEFRNDQTVHIEVVKLVKEYGMEKILKSLITLTGASIIFGDAYMKTLHTNLTGTLNDYLNRYDEQGK